MKLPLEDHFEDVLGKAMRGMNLESGTLSFLSGVPAAQIEQLLDGQFDETALRGVAGNLGLDAATLVERAKNSWQPEDVELGGLRQFTTPHQDFTVNSYLVWDPQTKEAALFDTGTQVADVQDFVESQGLVVRTLFITHTHVDHITALDAVKAWGEVTVRISGKEPIAGAEKFQAGEEFLIGSLKVDTRSTWGHSPGATTFVVNGLERPVAIVGDALFAQSMGGGVVSYQAALETNRNEIFTLPDETIICPGHGPMTSVGEEKAHNPFYPEFKSFE